MKKWLLAFALAAFSTAANAAIVISNSSVSFDNIQNNYQWVYTFAVQPDQNMRVNCTVNCTMTHDFVALFDFAGFVAGSASVTVLPGAAGRTFSLTQQNTGVLPPSTAITDSAAMPNFIVALTGGGDIIPSASGGAINAFNLNLRSIYGNNGGLNTYAAQAYNKSTGNTASNVNTVAGPSNPVPEPATFVLLGTALVGLGVLRRRA